MNAKQLFIPLALIGVCSVGTTPAGAAIISFSEDPASTASIVVNLLSNDLLPSPEQLT